MTLDKTWEECLRMWKWISEKWDELTPVYKLKRQYLEEIGVEDLFEGCFFCDYAGEIDDEDDEDDGCARCEECPGVLVDPDFRCGNFAYSYSSKPQEFYQELLRLNAIRLGEQSDGASSDIQKN